MATRLDDPDGLSSSASSSEWTPEDDGDESSVRTTPKQRYERWLKDTWSTLVGPLILTALAAIVWVAIQMTTVSTTLSHNGKTLDSLETDISTLKTDVGTLKTDVGLLNTQMTSVSKSLDRLVDRVDSLETSTT